MTNISFNIAKQSDWAENKIKVIDLLERSINYAQTQKKSFIVEIRRNKTNAQLRGFHRLLGLIAQFRSESEGKFYSISHMKDLVKLEYGYFDVDRGEKIIKECKYATIEDMRGLIETATVFGTRMGIEDCYLMSYEEQELERFYQLKITNNKQ